MIHITRKSFLFSESSFGGSGLNLALNNPILRARPLEQACAKRSRERLAPSPMLTNTHTLMPRPARF